MSMWQQRPSLSFLSPRPENALNGWMSSAVTLILGISMVQPSEPMMMVTAVITMILMALFSPGDMMNL